MELKVTEVNKYGYRHVKCPFCEELYSLSTNPLGGIQRHIKNQAKNEALAYLMGETKQMGEHLMYFKAHTSKKKVVVTDTFQFDEDLTLPDGV